MNLLVSLSNTKQRKPAIAIAIACSFLLVLPSCIPHLRNPAAGPALPERYNLRQADPGPDLPEVFEEPTSPENSSQVRIEEFFSDPMLSSLIGQALAGNQELRILGEDIQIASNEILARQGAYLPFVIARGRAGVNKIQQLHGCREPVSATIRFAPGGFFLIRCLCTRWAPPSYGRRISGGSCIMPGTRQGSATSPQVSGGTTS